MKVLGIESTCDETAIAIIEDKKILGHALYSQINLHQVYGGVVPEIAARAHNEKIDLLLQQVLKESNLSLDDIDIITAVRGPGLIGGVTVGLTFGKSLAYATNKKFVGVDHLEAHALMPRMESDIAFPHLVFLASGGHTQFILVEGIGQYKIIGSTQDDALGEAFDKTAKLLGLPYPGGPEVEKHAANGNPKVFDLPRPLKGYAKPNFSFSGLKSAVRRLVHSHDQISEEQKNDICAAFQEAACECVADRLQTALSQLPKIHGVAFAGGVARNQALRSTIESICKKNSVPFYVPTPALCVDNGVMIAWAGYERAQLGKFDNLSVTAYPRKSLEEVQ